QRLDIPPVLCELRLQLGDALLMLGDLGFEPLELARPLRRGGTVRLRLHLAHRRSRRLRELVASSDVVGPAAVVAADRSVLECERCRFVARCVDSSTVWRSSSSTSCCEKYAGTTPCPSRSRPAAGSRRSRIVSSNVVLPAPFGPTSATCSPRSIANETSRSSVRPGTPISRASVSRTVRPLRGGSMNPKPSRFDWRVSNEISLLTCACSLARRPSWVNFA